MGLLPAICRGSDRWWLPLSAATSDLLGLAMLSTGINRSGPPDHTTRQIRQAIYSDPPLLIYCALHWRGTHVTLDELAEWVQRHIVGQFASGNAFLKSPAVDVDLAKQWRRQYDYFRTLPVEQWLQNAPLWLEIAGPKIPDAWKESWPQINFDGEPQQSQAGTNSGQMLQKLARKTLRLRSLEAAFDQRVEKSKLGALKQLAYGLSHEINNPLANISTRAQQLQRDEVDTKRQATLQKIVDQVYRAHDMIADLMFYANPPTAVIEACDLRETVQRIAQQFQQSAENQSIELRLDLPGNPALADADDKMIGEAIRAMTQNSIDAIGTDGTIVISIAAERDQWRIHVADSGPGLSAEAREHAFDPYFSGREAGRGLGLGLCLAYRVARIHRGDIQLAGGPTGCVATLTLPRNTDLPNH